MSDMSSPIRPCSYEVFLSFRGSETRNSFVSHLYNALNKRGIIIYIDQINIQRGQSISNELLRAIEGSKIAVVVFSKSYGSSTWCLNELVNIMKCREKFGMIVLPIFYDVDPSDVRKQTNSFGEAFASHVNRVENNGRLGVWREALTQAASLNGEDIRGKSEALCVEKIVDKILLALPPKGTSFTKDLVGIEYLVKEINKLVDSDIDEVLFIGIWGMGGVGKTTVARVIFDDMKNKFEGSCFLQDVRQKNSRLFDLQKTLLSKVLGNTVNILDISEGKNMIKERLCCKRVLLVLDDVDDIEQLEALAGENNWLGGRSRIIITTRNDHLLKRAHQIHEVKLLSRRDSMQLFCRHAFKDNQPPQDYFQLSHDVLEYCGDLPLALQILGSHLYRRKECDWRSTLQKLKYIPENRIFSKLEISFEDLEPPQQDVFLDIACFFRGKEVDRVKEKLESFGFHLIDFNILIEKSLISIYHEKNSKILDHKIAADTIQMHDLIQEMGWHIIRRKANNDVGSYSRLWKYEEIFQVLANDTAGDSAEGMVVSYDIKEDILKVCRGMFRKMNKLRFLEINDIRLARLCQDIDYLPNSLRWLEWWHYPAQSLPDSFQPFMLKRLEVPFSKVVQTPNFSYMPNLKVLNLYKCIELVGVHESIGVHKKLQQIILEGCIKLQNFPVIRQMESLITLNLRYSGLQNFPGIEEIVTALNELMLASTPIKCLPWSMGNASSLQKLQLLKCKNVVTLPNSLFRLPYLEELNLGGLDRLKYFTDNPQLTSLQRKRKMNQLIISETSGVQRLILSGCIMVEAMPHIPSNIKILKMDHCVSLTIPSLLKLLEKCKNLQYLSLERCYQYQVKQYDIPVSLLPLWDWDLISTVLCKREKNLKVLLPGNSIPDWFKYQSKGSRVTVTLPQCSCWFDEKLRGIAVSVVSASKHEEFLLSALSGNSAETYGGNMFSLYSTDFCDHFGFIYIPISIIMADRKVEELDGNFLFEVKPWRCNPLRWAFHLVYEGGDERAYSDDLVVIKDVSDSVDDDLADGFGFLRVSIKNRAKL